MGSISVKYTCGTFSVFNSFIDNFIKEANPSYIKVYLYILRHANSNRKFTLSQVSRDVGLIKSDVISALEYWNEKRVLGYNGDPDNIAIEIFNLDFVESAKAPEAPEETIVYNTEKKKVLPRMSGVASAYNASEVVKTVSSDKKLSHMFSIIQQMLNKNLNSNDYKTIYSFIDYYKLPEPVVLILIEYCISINQTSMNYIEKVVCTWCNEGIDTVEKAEAYVNKQNEKNTIHSYYKKKFKITGRELAESEIVYIMSWVNDIKADEELIMSAYERAVMNTGKISFAYMDAIIRSEAGTSANKNTGNSSSFKNYPASYKISETEKERIQRMLAEFEDGDK